MARDVVQAVLWRQAHDAAFRSRWAADATAALRSYELTEEERLALRDDDRERLHAWGLTTWPAPPEPGPRLEEHQTVVIPLTLSWGTYDQGGYFGAMSALKAAIQACADEAAEQGWSLAHPTDWNHLTNHQQVEMATSALTGKVSVSAATIHLQR